MKTETMNTSGKGRLAAGAEGVDRSTTVTIEEAVRDRYGRAAAEALRRKEQVGADTGCCSTGTRESTGRAGVDPSGNSAGCDTQVTRDLYDPAELEAIPAAARAASLGCGNPFALADLSEGETVLDLGSGGGIDVLLSARRVGDTGWAFGVDMTPEMLELAHRNADEAGARNVTFLKGTIDQIPLPAASVDVVISNCVINLAADKKAVFREAIRVLRPGGRLAISDIVARDGQSVAARGVAPTAEAWSACMDGALEEGEMLALLREVGFDDPEIEVTREYDVDGLKHLRAASVRAWKPLAEEEAASPAGTGERGAAPSASEGISTSDSQEDSGAEVAAKACCGSDCCA